MKLNIAGRRVFRFLNRLMRESGGRQRSRWQSAGRRSHQAAECLEQRALLTLLFHESFEAAGPNYDTGGAGITLTPSVTFNDGVDDHFQRTNGSDISNSSSAYSGQHGSFYWAAEDTDDNGSINLLDEQTLDITGIDISGHTNLIFSGLFAADGDTVGGTPGGTVFDLDDHVQVMIQVDGGGYQNAIWFESDEDLPPGGTLRLRQDTDFDGVGDGTLLDSNFQTFNFDITNNIGNGSTLDIRILVEMDGSQEEIAFDSLQINGDAVVVNTAPTVSASSAADVGETGIGDTSYSFTVTYSDNSAIDVSSIGTSDVTITGPGGPLTVTGATPNVGTDGTPRTVTYTATPPGGSWDAADNGTYTISVVGSQVGDDGTPQLFVAAGSVTTFNVNATNTVPTVSSFLAEDVINTDLGAMSYSFTVTYTDVGGVDVSSIDVSDVTVTGPGGPLTVTAAVEASGTDGSPKTATYTVTPPGGSWDSADNGTYTIGIVGSQVLDINGAAVAANASLTTFEVNSNKLLNETFETDGQSTRYTATNIFNNGTGIWNRTDGSDHTNIDTAYASQDRNYYWAAEDTDLAPGGADEQQFDITGVNISGFTDLMFSGLFAADGDSVGGTPGGTVFDLDDHVQVLIQVDGGGYQNALWFESDEDLPPGGTLRLRQDTDFDGVGDGTLLDSGFQAFSFDITNGISDGNTLDIRILVEMDGLHEEIAFDSLMVTGTAVPTNPAPLASSGSAANVGETEIGDTSYSFTVTYSDDSAIDVSSIGTSDVTITGPGGPLTVTGATPNVGTDGTPRTVTYTATPPGGSWDAADNGTYTISVVGSEVGDDGAPQLFVAAGSVTTFDVNATNTVPTVSSFLAEDVINTDLGETSYSFTVTYADVGGVDVSSIDTSDVTVTGPGGPLTVTAAVEASGTDGSPKMVTYTVTPPGGSWDAADNGTYTIGIVGGQVLDINGAAVAANASLTTFEVNSSKLLNETFETDGQSTRYTATNVFNNGTGIWNRTDGSDHTNISTAYTGQDRNYYWAAEDTDLAPGGADEQQFDITGVNIAGFTDLMFSGLFAADGDSVGSTPGGSVFDLDDHIQVLIQVDGGGYQNALWFESDEDLPPGGTLHLRQDTDFDGVGDGTLLDSNFQSFSFDVTNGIGDGTVLDIRILVEMDGLSEEIAFDSLMVTGTLVGFDFGDAPAPYPTVLADNGAHHVATGPTLGAARDTESDGQPSSDAGQAGSDGDDGTGSDDEDGIVFTTGSLQMSTTSATTGQVQVNLQNADGTSNLLNGWIDFNQDGDWNDLGEQIFTDFNLGTSNGIQVLNFSIPQDVGANVVLGDTFARFRLDTSGGLAPTGLGADGEVEDHAVSLVAGPVVLDSIAAVVGDPRPDLTWQAQEGAVRYEMWFSRVDINSSRIYSDTNIMTTTWAPPADLDPGKYRYWVRGFDSDGNPSPWSSPNTFQMSIHLTPLQATFDLTPEFQWSADSDAASYEIFIRTVSGDIQQSGIMATSYTPASDLPEGVLYWWVRAIGGGGEIGPWSVRQQAMVGGRTAVTGPTGTTADTTPQFDWQAVAGAGRYILHVETQAGTVVIREDNITGTSFTPTAALASGNYRVWVKAINSADNTTGFWSRPIDFTIAAVTEDAESDLQQFEVVQLASVVATDHEVQASSVKQSAATESIDESSSRTVVNGVAHDQKRGATADSKHLVRTDQLHRSVARLGGELSSVGDDGTAATELYAVALDQLMQHSHQLFQTIDEIGS